MTLSQHLNKSVVTISPDASVREAANRMEQSGTGCLVVAGTGGEPVGILTDRDLTLRVAAKELNPEDTHVAAVMSQPTLTATQDESFAVIVEKMRDHGIRRLPVTEDGKLIGLVSMDDLLIALSQELADLGEASRREFWQSTGGTDVESILHEITGFLGWSPHGRTVAEDSGS